MKIKKEVVSYVEDNIETNGLTVLSKEEYEEYKGNIKSVDFWWWLRSPAYTNYNAFIVNTICCLDHTYVVSSTGSVRPVLKLKKHNLSVHDKFKMYNHNWTVISNQYALCDESFCKMAFRKNITVDKANNYLISDIKKYLDEQWEMMGNE